MLKNQNIICISSIDWDFIWQGHQEIMSALAQNGNRVLFIENTGVRTLRIRDIPRI
ncbi:MAG: glycosyltransferase family 1 protein, partial [Candidatus Omnitrophica bacterium]|nr:glycosyltransferase family 1 protein [Candidatus Omnitrophota bacterium]